MYIKELLSRQINNDKIAIKHGTNLIGYTEWYLKSQELSNIILNSKGKYTNNIAIFLPNSIEYAIAYFGISFLNKVIIPIGVQAKALEIKSTLEYCEVDLIVSSLEYKDFLYQVLSDYNYKIILLFIEDNHVEVIEETKPYIEKTMEYSDSTNENDTAIMLHTSGTTSNPKRVMLTHVNLITNIESNIKSLNLSEYDKTLICMPMHFGYCNTAQFLTHIYLGGSIVIMNNIFLAKNFFETIQKERITNFTGVPSMLLIILEYRYYDRYDITSVRYICFGGGRMPLDQLKRLISRFSTVGFVQTYGQTEASPRITALLPKYALSKIGSVGKPIPNVKVKIIVDNELGLEHIGEIIVQGKNIMKGYFKQKKITSEKIKGGWLYTGDLGYFDDEGFLYITGRKQNMLICGGINIYPEEIEEVLMQHSDVIDVYVFAEEHKLLGEVPVAKIILKKGETNETDLRVYCANILAEYKIPSRFYFVDKFHKTYNGKIVRY